MVGLLFVFAFLVSFAKGGWTPENGTYVRVGEMKVDLTGGGGAPDCGSVVLSQTIRMTVGTASVSPDKTTYTWPVSLHGLTPKFNGTVVSGLILASLQTGHDLPLISFGVYYENPNGTGYIYCQGGWIPKTEILQLSCAYATLIQTFSIQAAYQCSDCTQLK